MAGRSQLDSFLSAMEDLKSGNLEALCVPWEPIARCPGDTTGTNITNLPGHFRTEFRKGYLHGSMGYACPKERRNGLKCSTHGRGMHKGEQEWLYTSRSMWTSMHYATKFELKFYSKEGNCFEDSPYQEVSKYFQMVYAIQGKAKHPHHFERLRGHNRNAAKRAKLHQSTHNSRVSSRFCT